MGRRVWGIVVGAGLAALNGAAQAKPDEVLLAQAPTTAHPLYAWTREDELLAKLVHAPLFAPDGQGGFTSDLVLDVKVDAHLVTLELNPKVRWHDRHPFGPADVCATIVRVQATDRPTRYTAAARASVATCTPGDRKHPGQVTLALTGLVSDPRAVLTFPLVPAHAPQWAGAGPQSDLPPIGLGPYALDRKDGGWHLTAVDGRARLSRVDLVVVDDPAAALVAGRGIGAPFVAPAALGTVRADPSLRVDVVPADRVWALMINPSRAPLDQVGVRTALDLLVDRVALGGGALGRDEELEAQPWTPVSGPFPPRSPAYNAGVPVPIRDEPAARALLEAHGLVPEGDGWTWAGKPFTLRLAVPVGLGPDPERVRLALEQQLVGIRVEVVPLSAVQWWLSLLGGSHAQTTDLALVPLPASPTELSSVLHARTATRGWANPFGWSDAEVDGWLGGLADRNTAHLLHGRVADVRPALFLWAEEGRAAWRGPAPW